MGCASSEFYVYEHWRPDKKTPFYVGKGRGKRALSRGRNKRHREVVAELARLGLVFEVRYPIRDLTDLEAYKVEKMRITFWRSRGAELANMTRGGLGGISRHTPETRAKIKAGLTRPESRAKRSAKSRTAWADPEYRARMSAARAAMWADPEYIAKHSTAMKAREAASPETRAKLSAALKAACTTPKGRARMRATSRAAWADPETHAKSSASLRAAWAADPERHTRLSAWNKARAAAKGRKRRAAGPRPRRRNTRNTERNTDAQRG